MSSDKLQSKEEDLELVEDEHKSDGEDTVEDQPEDANKQTESKDEVGEKPKKDSSSKKFSLSKILKWRPTKKQALISAGVLALFVILWLIPFTRNLTYGSIFKTNLTIEAYDETEVGDENSQKVKLQLSELTVKVDGQEKASGATSPVFIGKLKPGKHKVEIIKSNYKTVTTDINAKLKIGKQNNSYSTKLEATGIPTKVKVSNFISGDAVKGVQVAFNESKATTNDQGTALIILPIQDSKDYLLELSGENFTTKTESIKLDGKKTIDLSITPAGKLYYLSKASGKIDVVKSNLDGTEKKVVFPGTGKEIDGTTTMISTTDWKYLALSTHRTDKTSQIIIIDTSDDSNKTVDEGNANFTLYGWDNKKLVFTSENSDINTWATGKYKIKSYDADNKSLAVIYRNAASGSNNNDANFEVFNFVSIVNHNILYATYTSGNGSGETSISLASISSGRISKLYSVGSSTGYLELTYTSAEEAYYRQWNYATSKYSYFEVNNKGEWKTQDKEPENTAQYTYFISPDGTKLLWSEERDGKQTILLGNAKAENAQKLYSLSELKPYAWFTNDYALYSKNNSEIYIASIKANSTPKKVTDYHRPANIQFKGYGGGGGGPY